MHITSNGGVTEDDEMVVVFCKVYPSICLEELNNYENLQASWSAG